MQSQNPGGTASNGHMFLVLCARFISACYLCWFVWSIDCCWYSEELVYCNSSKMCLLMHLFMQKNFREARVCVHSWVWINVCVVLELSCALRAKLWVCVGLYSMSTVDEHTYLKGSCLWWLGGRWLCPNKGIYCLWLYIPTLWSACLLTQFSPSQLNYHTTSQTSLSFLACLWSETAITNLMWDHG